MAGNYGNGACVTPETIDKMRSGGASYEDIRFAQRTMNSTDANDVARHRDYINRYNPSDPWKQPNNFIMHPSNYQFGSGNSSPQYIGGMFSTLQEPVVIHGPRFAVPIEIEGHVIFLPF